MLCPRGEELRDSAVECDPEASDDAVKPPRPIVDPGDRVARAFRALMTEFRTRPWAQPGWRPPGVMDAATAMRERAWRSWVRDRERAVIESLASDAPVDWARTGIDAEFLRAAERQVDLADHGRDRDAFLRAVDQLAGAFRAAFARRRSRPRPTEVETQARQEVTR
jgi:hypothetical protein